LNAAPQSASGDCAPLDRIEANLPQMLFNAPIWLLHRQKQPFYADGTPRRGTLDSPEDRARLVTYWKARAAMLIHDVDGVGVALGKVPGTDINLCGIDLDNCFTEGKLQDHAQQLLSAANSYVERSPSGNGLHIIGIGEIGTTAKAGLEIYSGKRYFTVTGDAINEANLADLSGAAALARRLFGSEPPAATANAPSSGITVIEGGRNTFLIREAGKLQRIDLDPSALRAAVHTLNQSRCQPPLPDEEVDAIAHGILRYPPNPQAVPSVAAGSFTPIPDETFVNRPPLEWHIKGVLPKSGLAIVYGASGSGKSFLVLAMVAAIATGSPWHGHKTHKARAVVVLAEGAGGFQNRLKAYATERGALPGIAIIDHAPHLLDAGQCQRLSEDVLQAGGIDIIVIDTLMAACPGADENTAKDMGRAIDNVKQISTTCNATVILVHHSGKDESRGARGWSGLKAAVDAEIEVSRSGVYHTARVSKLKDGEDGAEFTFKLRPVVVGMDSDGDTVKSCVVEPVTDSVPTMRRKEPREGNLPHKVLGVIRCSEPDLDGWISTPPIIETVAQQLPLPIGRDTRPQKITRALESLAVSGHIRVEGERCRLA
jgi:hypothetical protein